MKCDELGDQTVFNFCAEPNRPVSFLSYCDTKSTFHQRSILGLSCDVCDDSDIDKLGNAGGDDDCDGIKQAWRMVGEHLGLHPGLGTGDGVGPGIAAVTRSDLCER